MHDNGNPEVDKDLLDQLGYEHQDVEVDARLGKGLFWFFMSVNISVVVAWAVIGLVDRTQINRPTDQQMSRVMMPPKDTPMLQSDLTAKKDIGTLRAEEQKKMEHIGWVDKEPSFAQVPVETAMKIVAERGLPTRPNAKNPEESP